MWGCVCVVSSEGPGWRGDSPAGGKDGGEAQLHWFAGPDPAPASCTGILEAAETLSCSSVWEVACHGSSSWLAVEAR